MSNGIRIQNAKKMALRDANGRFLKGTSGNPLGRPRLPPAPTWTLVRALSLGLAEAVSARGADGSMQTIELRDLLVRNFLHGAVKAKPKDQLVIFDRLGQLGALEPIDAANDDRDPYSEEDRRVLAFINAALWPETGGPFGDPVVPSSQKHGDFGWG